MRRHGRFIPIVIAAGIAVTLTSTAASAAPGADVRLSNDFSGWRLRRRLRAGDGQQYTNGMLMESSWPAAARTSRPWPSTRATRASWSAARTTTAASTTTTDANGVPVPGRADLAGLLPLRERRRYFQSSLVPATRRQSPYAALAQSERRSRATRCSPGTPTADCSRARSSSDDRRNPKTFGDVWVATFDNPGGPNGATINDGKRYVGRDRRKGRSAPNLLGEVQRQDRHRGRPHPRVLRRQRLLRLVPLHRQRHEQHLLLPLDRPRRHLVARRRTSPPSVARRPGPRHRHHRQRPRLRDLGRHGRASGPRPTRSQYAKPPAAARLSGLPVPDGRDVRALQPTSRQRLSRDCGDAASACPSGYTFLRADTTPGPGPTRTTSGQTVHLVFDAADGPDVPTGTSVRNGRAQASGSQSVVYYTARQRRDRWGLGAGAGRAARPAAPDLPGRRRECGDCSRDLVGQPPRPVCGRTTCAAQPIGNAADRPRPRPRSICMRATFAAGGGRRSGGHPAERRSTNPNFEQFGGRPVPFGGDYLWVSSAGGPGRSARGPTGVTPIPATMRGRPRWTAPSPARADVKQCRATRNRRRQLPARRRP